MASEDASKSIHDLIFNTKPKYTGEGDSGDTFATLTPVALGLAAIALAKGVPAFDPSPEASAELSNYAAAELDHGMTPSPFGTSSPDPQSERDPKEFANNPNKGVHTHQNAQGDKAVVLDSNHGHAYITHGKINGKLVTFLVDTGATQVSIPRRIADAIGLVPTSRSVKVRTASGVITTYQTFLDSVTIGEIELNHVEALINPDDRSEQILLGMSALKHLEMVQSDGKLTLRQLKK
jgi:aspartyl protease family protein